MPRTNAPNETYENLSLRLKGEEAERLREALKRGLGRNNFADKSDVIRELIGLDPPELLTAKEIEQFRGLKPPKENEYIDAEDLPPYKQTTKQKKVKDSRPR